MKLLLDEEIWRYARDQDYCIVTKDADFYDLSLVRGAPPKVIWLKIGNVTKSAIAHALIANREYLESRLAEAETTCVELY
jgi:predicted nuclease of predicted toxin-antitoxin system